MPSTFTTLKNAIRLPSLHSLTTHAFSFFSLAAKALELQLILSLASAPLLIYAGLSLSLAGIISTLLFTPLFSLFLFCSSLLFFSELLHLPNGIIILLTEWSGRLLYAFIELPILSPISIPAPSLTRVLLILGGLLITIHLKPRYRALRLICLSTLTLLLITSYHTPSATTHFTRGNHTITLINATNTIILIDHGLQTARNIQGWYAHDIAPTLRREYGAQSPDILVSLKPSTNTVTLARACANSSLICYYAQPYDTKKVQNLKTQLAQHTILKPLTTATKNLPLVITETDSLTATCTGIIADSNKPLYPAIKLTYTTDEQIVTLTQHVTLREQVLPLPPQ